MRAQATRATRPEKEIHSLFDLTTEWRGRAQKILGRDAVEWAKEVTARPIARPTLRADDVPLDAVGEVGRFRCRRGRGEALDLEALEPLGRGIPADDGLALRQCRGPRGRRRDDRRRREAGVAHADAAELATTPEVFRRPDGTSRFRPRHSVVFTSEALLAAEDRLLARAEDRRRPERRASP